MIIVNKINIKYLTEEGYETVKKNVEYVFEQIKNNPRNNTWVYELLPKNPFTVKTFQIDDFELKYADDSYNDVDYDNSILLYENLKNLPRRVLTDERFWLWLYLEKFYDVAVQVIDLKSPTTILNHWMFTQGSRRGLFFGSLSRSYFRVELSVDETLSDKYLLTKYVIEKPERFRTLSWRSYSSNKTIVLGALKAQRDFEYKYPNEFKNHFYNLISKRISRYGSVNLLDSATEIEIYEITYQTLEELSGV